MTKTLQLLALLGLLFIVSCQNEVENESLLENEFLSNEEFELGEWLHINFGSFVASDNDVEPTDASNAEIGENGLEGTTQFCYYVLGSPVCQPIRIDPILLGGQ